MNDIQPLEHPLEPYGSLLRQLLEVQQNERSRGASVEQAFLQAVRQSCHSDHVGLVEHSGPSWELLDQVPHGPFPISIEGLTQALEQGWKLSLDGPMHRHGWRLPGAERAGWLAIPIPRRGRRTTLLVGPSRLPPGQITGLLGQCLRALLVCAWAQPSASRERNEAFVLDTWKQEYGFLPYSLFLRRRELFRRRLHAMTVCFEPIVEFAHDHLRVVGYEALARDPESGQAPEDLFHSAELFETPLVEELDTYFLNKALERFRDAAPPSTELSVNVSPRTLLQEDLVSTLAGMLAWHRHEGHQLVLEISEKSRIPGSQEERFEPDSRAFTRQLVHLQDDLGIRFAIDDFGSGHASIARVAALHPMTLKVDREILHSSIARETLRFLVDLVHRQVLPVTRIVAEGVDDRCPLSLRELHRIGLQHLQGHRVGRAEPSPAPLDPDTARGLLREWNLAPG